MFQPDHSAVAMFIIQAAVCTACGAPLVLLEIRGPAQTLDPATGLWVPVESRYAFWIHDVRDDDGAATEMGIMDACCDPIAESVREVVPPRRYVPRFERAVPTVPRGRARATRTPGHGGTRRPLKAA